MDAVTHPSALVTEFVSKNVVLLRVLFDSKLADQFNVHWTPTLVVLDPEGKEHQRNVGFLPPEELIAFLMLGEAKCAFDDDRVDEAADRLDRLLTTYPKSAFAPEAVYLRGVARFKVGHEAKHLKEAYETLKEAYPGSPWETRAYPYRLL